MSPGINRAISAAAVWFKRFPLKNKPVSNRLSTNFLLSRSSLLQQNSTSSCIRSFEIKSLHTMKLVSEAFKSIFTPELRQLSDIFNKHGYELRIAGGAVRDLLMDIRPSDLDFATTATPNEMKEMFNAENIRMINLGGEKHGTITARINDKENFEVTTLRIDVVNHGRHADVEFTKNWELDANRRDLTINSMFLGFDGTVFDYCGGWEDLKKRRVAFVGDAATRIKEDYLRILRYFRFCARVSLNPSTHEADTETAIRENMEGLSRISGERIWTELKRILTTPHAGPLLESMLHLGMAPYIGLGDDLNMDEFKQVWQRTRASDIQLEAVSLLAALIQSEDAALALRERLKYPTYDKELSIFLIRHRNILPDPLNPLRPYQMIVIDFKNKIKDAKSWCVELLKYQGKADMADELDKWIPPKFPVTGHDLKNEGVPGGKPMTLVTDKLRKRWKEANFQISHEELLRCIPDVLEDLGIKKSAR